MSLTEAINHVNAVSARWRIAHGGCAGDTHHRYAALLVIVSIGEVFAPGNQRRALIRELPGDACIIKRFRRYADVILYVEAVPVETTVGQWC